MSSSRSLRAKRGPSGPLFFALSLALFSALSAAGAEPILNWIKSPEAYFATAEELRQWKAQVLTTADARKFITEYWRKRGEAFRKEVLTRIEFADGKFGLGEMRGSQTAMGETFIILGAPNEQKTIRGGTMLAPSAGTNPLAGRMQDNPMEQQANLTDTWVYRKERLPADLGISELRVDFITDVARGKQSINNPGNVVPYLRKAAAQLSNRAMVAAATPASNAPLAPGIVADALWNLTPALNGAIVTGDAFLSPREEPFYAVSFYLPKSVATFNEWKSGLLVALIRDDSGKEVVAERQPVSLLAYDADGNRYVDRSYALAPGAYDAMFVLYSPEGGTLLASSRQQFEVAAPTEARASSLLLTSHIDTLESQDAFDPFTFVAQKYAVRGDRTFRMSDRIVLFTVVANPAGSPTPRLMQKLTLTHDGKSFAKTPLEPAEGTQTGPNTFLIGIAFDPQTFKPGHYTVDLQLRDFNAADGSEMRTKGYVLSSAFEVVQ